MAFLESERDKWMAEDNIGRFWWNLAMACTEVNSSNYLSYGPNSDIDPLIVMSPLPPGAFLS